MDLKEIRTRRDRLHKDIAVPEPPFWGARVLERVEPRALLPVLNEVMLYQFHWGFKKAGRSRKEWKEWADREVRPILQRMMGHADSKTTLQYVNLSMADIAQEYARAIEAIEKRYDGQEG